MALAPHELDELVSAETGHISRKIFSDEEIFEQEMQEIFAKAWLFLCHESQIPKRGDFFEAPMGRDNVLVVRQKDGSIRAFLNTCTHRGMSVCRAEEGNTRNFMCTYHGWTFDIDGELVGVPGYEKYYKGELDKSKHALRKVAQLDTFMGFVFATFDPTAPPLPEYLGETGRLALKTFALRGDMQVVPGIQKFVIDCNWKLPVDNVPDFYHPQITHMSANATGIFESAAAPLSEEEAFEEFMGFRADQDYDGVVTADGDEVSLKKEKATRLGDSGDIVTVIGEYGHFIGGPVRGGGGGLTQSTAWRDTDEMKAELGPVGYRLKGHPNIFPTMWITNRQISVRVPRSATSTEIWWYSFVPKDETEEEQRRWMLLNNHIFGPAGILEQEDGENWVQTTMQTSGIASREVPQTLQMNVGNGEIIHEHGLARIESYTNEHAQLWFYLAWAQWLAGGADWDSLRARTTPGERL